MPQARVALDTGGPPCDAQTPPAPASLTQHGADEFVGTGLRRRGTESAEIQPGPLPDGAEHWGWRVGRALEQSLQKAVHQEHRRPQAALVAPSGARLPKRGAGRRHEQRLGLGALLPLPMLAALLAVSLFHVFLLSLEKKRVQKHRGHLRPPAAQLSLQDGMRVRKGN